jgi:hypothetical protein
MTRDRSETPGSLMARVLNGEDVSALEKAKTPVDRAYEAEVDPAELEEGELQAHDCSAECAAGQPEVDPPAGEQTGEQLAPKPAEYLPARAISRAEIDRRFSYHRPEGDKVDDHDDARKIFKAFAEDLAEFLPGCRETSIVFTKLEEAANWAHAAIARPPATD